MDTIGRLRVLEGFIAVCRISLPPPPSQELQTATERFGELYPYETPCLTFLQLLNPRSLCDSLKNLQAPVI